MMKVHCHTNLDLMKAEVWPQYLPTVPAIGHRIQSEKVWKDGFQLQLEVCGITWKYSERDNWVPYIELHLTSIQKQFPKGLCGFYEWYAPKVGQSRSHFI